MQDFILSILPNYLISESGVKDDSHKKILHDSVMNEPSGNIEVTLRDMGLESTFKIRLESFMNDARFYVSLQS